MKVTEDYKNNIKEIEKFLYTFCFEEESEKRIRQFIDNPLSVLNDDIKALFKKYDNDIVDYRIPLPSSMITERTTSQKEIYLIMSLIMDCLSADDQFKFTVAEDGSIVPDFQFTPSTISNNFFKIKNDKRKVWKYLDSKSTSIAKKMYENWFENKTLMVTESGDVHEFISIESNVFKTRAFFSIMKDYIVSIGSRKTSLKDKINKFISKGSIIDVNGKSHSEIINIILNEIVKPILNIMQEIISAKMLDLEKYKLFLSFNVFDWLLASSGETWHSCIDMNSTYGYGTGLLGMCGCPDWGMLLYTDGTEKTFGGIKSYHIVTRSWICYTDKNDFQIINWYPKDMRSTVEFTDGEDIKFNISRSMRRSKSTWEPIIFGNGALAWIYSDMNRFEVTGDKKDKVFFSLGGNYYGLPSLVKIGGKIVSDGYGGIEEIIRGITRNGGTIWGAVEKGYRPTSFDKKEESRCSECGCLVDSEEDLVYIESEDISVCNHCLENNFFVCDCCGDYHRYDGDCVEVCNGPFAWDYLLYCRNCLDWAVENGEVYWDDFNHAYYLGADYTIVHNADGSCLTASPYSLERVVNEGSVFKHNDGEYYSYAETPEGAN